MSIRTVVEINHDRLHDLQRDPVKHMELLCYMLGGCDHKKLDGQVIPGIRYLGQRHHADELTVTVK